MKKHKLEEGMLLSLRDEGDAQLGFSLYQRCSEELKRILFRNLKDELNRDFREGEALEEAYCLRS